MRIRLDRRSWVALGGLATLIVLPSCGHRGNPRPPVYPEPPAVQGLIVSQRGSAAILRFPAPEARVEVIDETVEIDSVEILVYAERYPIFDADTLIAALEVHRDLLVEQAREAAAAAERARLEEERRRAEAAGEEVEEEAGEEPETPTRAAPTPEEEALRRVPPEVLRRWRAARVRPDALVHSANLLGTVVARLWQRLGQPTTVLDPDQPPPLPEPAVIAGRIDEVLGGVSYERQLPWDRFVGRAAVPFRIPMEEIDRYRVDELVQVAYTVPPSPGRIRTRYFFAVRTRSTRDRAGLVRTVVPLAPVAVPVAPTDLVATVTREGVELSWRAPTGDELLRRLQPDDVAFNVYRAEPGDFYPPTPLNPAPLTETSYTDTSMRWEREYLYQVRAMRLPVLPSQRHESAGAETPVLDVVDTFAPEPPSELELSRAGDLVSLDWSGSPAADLAGYRVYRHALPAPPLPERDEEGWVVPLELRPPRQDPEAGAEERAGGERGETEGRPGGEEATDEPALPNPMVEAGWQLMVTVPGSRWIDRDADPETRYAYAIEAIDPRGNLSAVVMTEEPGR